MRCDKTSYLIQLYIDKQLNLEQTRTLEQHLVICSACREELFIYEEINRSLVGIDMVVEPANMTTSVMQRVAWTTRQAEEEKRQRRASLVAFRPSLSELLTAVLLASFAMLGVVLSEPSLRAALPIANGHDPLSLLFIQIWNSLLSLNSGTLMLVFWVLGTLLGVWITLWLAGSEMRGVWFRAVMSRLPVW